MAHADKIWSEERVVGGISSGEGLIAAVRDASGDDPGETDKRLFVVEPEFARVLAVAARDGSTVSHVIRDAWDTGTLRNLTKRDPLKATGAHISIIGHITAEELTRRLPDTEIANGFANRFLFLLVDRSQLLPSGGELEPKQYESLGRKTRGALEKIRRLGRLRRSPQAEELWRFLYGIIASQDVGGLFGSVRARAEAHLLRVGLLYALADASATVEVDHLEAAWSLLCYADDSARYIFGSTLGDRIADRILAELRKLPIGTGLDGTEQRDLFGRHATGKELEAAREYLRALGLIENILVDTGGRPRIVSFLRCDESDQSDQSRDMSLRSLRSHQEKETSP
ncbi:MAG: YfjI family protein [Actinomycetota bacterium]|nr:YfjI family protein [Actinomycetota bacterium]